MGKKMDLKQIDYFIQLARIEHVSQTADFLNISQSTLSKSVSALEKELGIQLFDRVGNRIRLNENGKAFLEYAGQGIAFINTAVLQAKQKRYEVTGNISIGCWAFAPILMPCITDYAKLNPHVHFNIVQYERHLPHNIGELSFDFILASSTTGQKTVDYNQIWDSEELFTENAYAVIGPKYPGFEKYLELESIEALTMLKDEQFIWQKNNLDVLDSVSVSEPKVMGFVPKIYFQTDDFLVRMHALRAGRGIMLLPESCLEDAKMLCPGLKVLKIDSLSSYRTIVLMHKKESFMGEAALDFWEFIRDYYGFREE